jgi:HAD superfamily hydrolase (TIGR01509 family)
MALRALIFDVDGTLAETEELHRAAFNDAFASAGLDWIWDVDRYRELLHVTGGKERIRRFANHRGLSSADLSDAEIADLHRLKNEGYAAMMRAGLCALRPGVARLIDAARAERLRLAICTTTSRANVDVLIEATLDAVSPGPFELIVSGDEAPVKKPAPDAYWLVLRGLGLSAGECLAFEDSRNGLLSAHAAGISTVITPSRYTAHESFDGAARILPDLAGFDPWSILPRAADASPVSRPVG